MTLDNIVLVIGAVLGSSVIAALIRSWDERRKEKIERPAQIDAANLGALEAMRMVMEELRSQSSDYQRRLSTLEAEVAALRGERKELRERVSELEAENRRLKATVGILAATMEAVEREWKRLLPDVPFPGSSNNRI